MSFHVLVLEGGEGRQGRPTACERQRAGVQQVGSSNETRYRGSLGCLKDDDNQPTAGKINEAV